MNTSRLINSFFISTLHARRPGPVHKSRVSLLIVFILIAEIPSRAWNLNAQFLIPWVWKPMKPRPELLASYSATAYIVHFEDHDYTIRIGDDCEELDELMIQHEVGTWTVITAYNPLSEKLSAKENAKRNEKPSSARVSCNS